MFGSKAPTRSAAPAAAPKMSAPPAQGGGGMMSGLGSTMMTGMAFGAGSEVAHQAVRGIMGSGSGHDDVQQQQAPPQEMQQ